MRCVFATFGGDHAATATREISRARQRREDPDDDRIMLPPFRCAVAATIALLTVSASALRVPAPTSRRAVIGSACLACSGAVLPSGAANAAEKKPNVKDIVAQLDKDTPKEERNSQGDKAEFFPKITFEGSQGQGRKVVFTSPHENLSPPSFSYIEYMWIKDESSGAILTAKKFSASDPNLVITAFGSSGQTLTAASKDNKNGIWQGTFRVP